jgi:protein SCO1/2
VGQARAAAANGDLTVIRRPSHATLAALATILVASAACSTPGSSGTSAPASPDPAPTTVASPSAPASAGATAGEPVQASAVPADLPASPALVSAPASSSAPAAIDPSPLADAAPLVALDGPRPAPPLEGLLNADGTPFSMADYAGTPTLVFFGYTHCPDVCPSTIGELFGVFQAQPEAKAVFVSVDPERDTPEFLAKWTEYFPENFDAITGSPGAIRRAADGYGVKYARVETSSKSGYTMSHTANVYLIDGDGQLRRTYPFGTPAAEMAADIATLGAG